MKKGLAFLLALLMLCPMLLACGDTAVGETTGAATETVATTDPNAPDVPAELTADVSGDFTILVAGNYTRNDFQAEADAQTVVEAAIYRRNETLKEKFGVNVNNEDITKFGSATGSGTGFRAIYNEYMAGESTYDAAMIGTYDVASLAPNGYIYDLNELPNLDLSKDYWDQRANNDLAILGRMYYTTGDISIVDNLTTHALLFNKDMVANYGLESPYDYVYNDNWTFETFGAMVKQIGEDLDQNGIYNEMDRYGLMTWNDPMLAVLASAGERICTVGDSGKIELTFNNERVLKLYDQFEDIVFDQTHAYNYQYDNVTNTGTPSAVWNTNRDAIFSEGRALFYLNTVATVERHRDSNVEFGVLPYPKLEASQAEYGHNVSAYHCSFLCVPTLIGNDETKGARTGAILEQLAYYGREMLTPAYYEKTLVGKSVRDEESSEMLDIIFATHVFDVGIYYKIGTYKDELGKLFTTRQSIPTLYATYESKALNEIETINEVYASIPGAQ